MKTKLSFLLGVISLCSLEAQIIYNSEDFGDVNNQFEYQKTKQVTGFNFTTNGDNITWNYNLVPENDSIIAIINPENSNYKSFWCNNKNYNTTCDSEFSTAFNQGINQSHLPFFTEESANINQIVLHYKKDNNQISNKLYGIVFENNSTQIPALLEYSLPDILYKFPMTMGDNYVEPFDMESIFPSQFQNINLKLTGNRENLVDGWGTLVVGQSTFNNVIRLKTTADQNLVITNNGTTHNKNQKFVSYQWFSKAHKYPVLKVEGFEINGNFVPHYALFFNDETVLAATDFKYNNLAVYPNPTKGLIKTNVDTKDILKIEVYNTAGQIVHNNLNISHLKSGNYLIKIITKNEVLTKKVIKH